MSTVELAPRPALPGIILVWVFALVVAVAIGIFVPFVAQAAWLCVGLGACLVVTFAVQVVYAHPAGFIRRVGLSMVGSLFIMGIVSLGFGLANLMSGGV